MRTSTGPAGQFADTCAASCAAMGVTAGGARRPAATPGHAGAAAPAAAASAADRHALHRQFERGAGPRGFDLVGAFLEVLSGDGPAVAPEQRTDVEHADAAAIEVGFVVHENFCTPSPRSSRPKCPGPMRRPPEPRNSLPPPCSMSMPMLSRNGPVTFFDRPMRML